MVRSFLALPSRHVSGRIGARATGPGRGRRSDDFRRQADDLHELAVAQLAGDRPEDARAAGILLVVDEDHGVAVEFDVRAVRAAGLGSPPPDPPPGPLRPPSLAPRGGPLCTCG